MSETLVAPQPGLRKAMKTAGWIVLGVALLTLAAKLHIPSWPVPMTLQTFAVMTIAIAAGPRLASATFLAYLAAGVAGLPVFSGTPERGIGLAYMMGPTGGYLFGYLIASGLVGRLAVDRGLAGRIAAMLAGLTVVYAAGLAWLALIVQAEKLLPLGILPFLPSDLISIAVVGFGAALVPARLVGRIGR